jgi:hypothetical protein
MLYFTGIKNGIDQARPPRLRPRDAGWGTRPELQGGGLIRSAGGKKADLLGRKKEERDLPASPERAQARDPSASAEPRDAGRVAGWEREMNEF